MAILISSSLQSQELTDYRWKNRLIVLYADDSGKAMEKQQRLLSTYRAELEERDIIVFEANAQINKQLNQASDFMGIILIGKDGGIKLKEPFVIEPRVIFTLIDGMPMRRSEIRNKKKS